jgi:hypothetical protein
LDDIVIGDDTDVTAGVDVSYIIVIPAAVDFGTLTKGSGIITKSFEVTADGMVLEDGARVEVDVAGPFVMKDRAGIGDVSLLYTLSNHTSAISSTGGNFTTFTEDRTETGSIAVNTTNIVNAGSYKGIMMFSVSYKK